MCQYTVWTSHSQINLSKHNTVHCNIILYLSEKQPCIKVPFSLCTTLGNNAIIVCGSSGVRYLVFPQLGANNICTWAPTKCFYSVLLFSRKELYLVSLVAIIYILNSANTYWVSHKNLTACDKAKQRGRLPSVTFICTKSLCEV